MKTPLFFAVTLLFFSLNSCSKKNSDDVTPNDKREGTISMQINGTTWSGECGAVDAKIGSQTNVSIVGYKDGKTAKGNDGIVITISGFTGTGNYSATSHEGSSISVVYNGITYSNDKKATVQPVVKITEGNLPTTPLGPGKVAGEFNASLRNPTEGFIEITNCKFQTTDIL
ncbi:hypothetical protein [Dyadobacter sp. CY312]|uniref:hypothetical protein n=1 Tax=Dyadobacter sp. CY312 TaxID=2907303 RepID=UPI001F1BC795|nr:hypothetical protein [Dyadobacter sp. CY312]MCE7040023.1 hypothetical protein [Dyadobacter sp. CY312]